MKIKVRLFGTLGKDFPSAGSASGIDVEIPEKAKVSDLLAQLKIPESRRAVVAIDGRIMKPDDFLQGGANVHVFESVFGG